MTDTDRELLEQNCELLALAANAAGYTLGMWIDGGEPYSGGPGWIINDRLWNPLTDDGDALRLAVKMRFHVCVFSATDGELVPMPGFVEVGREEDNDPLSVEYVDVAEYEDATRRAIVRAAAEIGRNMP